MEEMENAKTVIGGKERKADLSREEMEDERNVVGKREKGRGADLGKEKTEETS